MDYLQSTWIWLVEEWTETLSVLSHSILPNPKICPFCRWRNWGFGSWNDLLRAASRWMEFKPSLNQSELLLRAKLCKTRYNRILFSSFFVTLLRVSCVFEKSRLWKMLSTGVANALIEAPGILELCRKAIWQQGKLGHEKWKLFGRFWFGLGFSNSSSFFPHN